MDGAQESLAKTKTLQDGSAAAIFVEQPWRALVTVIPSSKALAL
jgi:hypothetical protein